MEATSRRGQGRRKLASGRRFHSGKRSSLHGPLTFTLQALRKSLSAFDGEGKLPPCCDSTYLNASTVITQSHAQIANLVRAFAAYGAHVQPPDAVAEHDDNAATLGTNQCVIHMVSICGLRTPSCVLHMADRPQHTPSVHFCTTPVSMQADGDALANVVAWLRDICESDPEASLIFPPSLSKEQRAQIHTLVQAVGLGALASVSKGVGDNRHITVVRIGQEDASSQVTHHQILGSGAKEGRSAFDMLTYAW